MKITKCFSKSRRWMYVHKECVAFWGSLGAYCAHTFRIFAMCQDSFVRIRKNGKMVARSATYYGI